MALNINFDKPSLDWLQRALVKAEEQLVKADQASSEPDPEIRQAIAVMRQLSHQTTGEGWRFFSLSGARRLLKELNES